MKISFDAGPLISFSNTCLLDVLDVLPFDPVVAPWVVNEILRFPRATKHYKLSALRIQKYINKGKIREMELGSKGVELADRIQHVANTIYFAHKRPLKLVHRGEVEALALAMITDGIFAVDERTIRMMAEDPFQLRLILESKMGMHITMDKKRAEEFQELVADVLMVRSVDLLAYAAELGAFKDAPDEREFVEAALYALKFAGCSVSEEEIREFLSVFAGRR